jgi:hypothetical protein
MMGVARLSHNGAAGRSHMRLAQDWRCGGTAG